MRKDPNRVHNSTFPRTQSLEFETFLEQCIIAKESQLDALELQLDALLRAKYLSLKTLSLQNRRTEALKQILLHFKVVSHTNYRPEFYETVAELLCSPSQMYSKGLYAITVARAIKLHP